MLKKTLSSSEKKKIKLLITNKRKVTEQSTNNAEI
jgi:hypothetical protein